MRATMMYRVRVGEQESLDYFAERKRLSEVYYLEGEPDLLCWHVWAGTPFQQEDFVATVRVKADIFDAIYEDAAGRIGVAREDLGDGWQVAISPRLTPSLWKAHKGGLDKMIRKRTGAA